MYINLCIFGVMAGECPDIVIVRIYVSNLHDYLMFQTQNHCTLAQGWLFVP